MNCCKHGSLFFKIIKENIVIYIFISLIKVKEAVCSPDPCPQTTALFHSYRHLQWTDLQRFRIEEWKHSLSEGVFKSVERSVGTGVRE
uniref:Uncharacterized protein n=1 Tax=Anguilla anguilla TaxID=7936 RepID=A0A0E9PQ76_ANGAN